MTPFTQTVEGVYLEIALYATTCSIITAILIIESVVWYLGTPTNTVEMITIPGDTTNAPTQKSGSTFPFNLHSPSSNFRNSVATNVYAVPYTRLLSISMYICYICGATAIVIARLGLGIHHHCDYIGIGGFFYMTAKCCLYLVLLYRLSKVYSGSMFQKSTKRLKFAAVFTVLWGIFLAVLNTVTIRKVIVMIDDNVYCSSQSHPFAIILLLLYDVTLNFGCCYAFTQPLLWLSKMKKSPSDSNGMYDAVIRYNVLTVVAVASTFLIMFAVIALKFNGLVMIDMALNSVCIMLFNDSYQRFYYFVCCGAHQICSKIIQMDRVLWSKKMS